MARMIFVNLPVADLQRSIAFYEAIGATNVPSFTDDTAAMMSFSEAINVMLLTHDKFRQFTSKSIADARQTTEVLIAISADSREAVEKIFGKAIAAGGRESRPAEDYGWMYARSFEDLDGHVWEPCWMDVEAATKATSTQPETADA